VSTALVETWAIGARISTYLLAGVPAAALDASPSGKGRTVRDLFAHIHDVRLLWLKAARPHEAHHRGQVAQALRLAGTPLDKKVSFGLWEWGVR
jgi:uncharacterized damage-inducible protein DinB